MPLNLDAYLSEPLQRSVIPALLTVVITLAGRALSPRSRVKWGMSHGFAFAVQQPTDDGNRVIPYHTVTIYVQNVGRAVADSVEVHFNYKPEHMQIWPTLNYDTSTNPENRFTVIVSNLTPKEHFTLELLSARPPPDVLRVRSSGGEGKQVPIAPAELFPLWVRRGFVVIMWLGLFEIVQNIYLWIYK
jgi:hypothetical protein